MWCFLIFKEIAAGDGSDNVCELLSFDPGTCSSVYGCGYCLDKQKCVSLATKDPKDLDNCVLSGQVLHSTTGDVGNCFRLYSDDGCTQCVAASAGMACGWCQSLGICLEGTASGPNSISCSATNWLFNRSSCTRSTCANINIKNKCVLPCIWSDSRSVCLMPRKLDSDSDEEQKLNMQIWVSKRIYIFVCILVVIAFMASIILTVWNVTKPKHSGLDLDHNLDLQNLDDVPNLNSLSEQ